MFYVFNLDLRAYIHSLCDTRCSIPDSMGMFIYDVTRFPPFLDPLQKPLSKFQLKRSA